MTDEHPSHPCPRSDQVQLTVSRACPMLIRTAAISETPIFSMTDYSGHRARFLSRVQYLVSLDSDWCAIDVVNQVLTRMVVELAVRSNSLPVR